MDERSPRSPTSEEADRRRGTLRALALSALLALSIFAVYGQVRTFRFLSYYDDVEYVSQNPMVSRGLSPAGIAWALTHFHVGNWHPLTSMSHMLDCSLFGLEPGLHHLTNVVLHALNSILLLWLLRYMTGALWRSAAVAALFALHPLHVESVAWISERKDVLCTLFGWLALGAYVRHVRSPSRLRYAAVLLTLTLGLLSKPMLVTFPLLMLCLDFWPLGRFGAGSERPFGRALRRLVREKLPLFALAAAFGAVTFVAQRQSGAVVTLERLPLARRVANALVSLVDYLRDAFWPAGLSAFYPQVVPPTWRVALALLVLVLVTALAFRARRRAPHLIVGWLWYLVSLLPVIGLVQVGLQARADRYTYVPLVGIALMVAWGAGELVWTRRKPAVVAWSSGLVLAALAGVSWNLTRSWRDSITLFERAVAVTEENWFAHYHLAAALTEQGRFSMARPHFFEAARIEPSYAQGQVGVGYALEREGRVDQALLHYREAIRLLPTLFEAHVKLGNALMGQGKLAEALPCLAEAVRLAPSSATAHHDLGAVLRRQGRLAEAALHLAEAVRLRPNWAEGHDALGVARLEQGEPAEALRHFTEAVRLEPDSALARAHAEAARSALAARASGAGDEP